MSQKVYGPVPPKVDEATKELAEGSAQPDEKKIRVLWLSDSPTRNTGFGHVARNVLAALQATGKYDFTIIGINHSDWYDRDQFPYRIFEAAPALATNPMHRDMFGRQRLLDFIGTGKFDLLFTLQDTFIMEEIGAQIAELRSMMQKRNKELGREVYRVFKWIYYYPIDARPMANWLLKSMLMSDFPVCYTNYGKQQCIEVMRDEIPREQFAARAELVTKLEKQIRVIYHGSNAKEFYPIADRAEVDAWREKTFQGTVKGKFLIINVNRNQSRKDLTRTLHAFSRFYDHHQDSFLYLHCSPTDVGGNLKEIARNFRNLELGKNWGVPHDFDPGIGVKQAHMNLLYNAADLVVSTTWGEGWGLSFTEAFATKTLLLAPKNTSAIEIIGANEERGLFADCGTTDSEHISIAGDMGVLRPLVNIDSMVEKMNWAYDHRGDALSQGKIDAAYEWVTKLAWEGPEIGGKWLQVFEDAWAARLKEKWIGDNLKNVGRNELCPCGSGEKFKRCHGTI